MDKEETMMPMDLLRDIHRDVNYAREETKDVKKMIKHGHKGHKEHDMAMSETQYVGSGFGGGGGLGGGAFGVELIALLALLRNGGLGGGENTCNNILEAQISNLTAINASTTATAAAIAAVDTRIEGAIAGVKSELCNLRYENSQQTNSINQTIAAAAQSVKDQMTGFRISDLEQRLDISENGGPRVRAGVFVEPNPCCNTGGNDINDIKQVLIQVGTGLVGLQSAVAALGK